VQGRPGHIGRARSLERIEVGEADVNEGSTRVGQQLSMAPGSFTTLPDVTRPNRHAAEGPSSNANVRYTRSSTNGAAPPASSVMRVRFASGSEGVLPSAFNGFTLVNVTTHDVGVRTALA